MIFLIILICAICNFEMCTAQCTFEKYNSEHPPFFLNKYDEGSYNLLQHLSERVAVLEGAELIVFCPGGIQLLDPDNAAVKEELGTKKMSLNCVHNKLQIKYYLGEGEAMTENNIEEEAGFEEKFNTKLVTCSNYGDIKLYELMDIEGCQHHNYAVTIRAVNISIILAECCFDFEALRFRYIHHTARSSGLTYLSQVKKFVETDSKTEQPDDEDFDYNREDDNKSSDPKGPTLRDPQLGEENDDVDEEPDGEGGRRKRQSLLLPEKPPISRNEHSFINTTVPIKVFYFSQAEYDMFLPNITPYKHLVYLAADLFPKEAFHPYFPNPFQHVAIMQKFIGWRNLIYGNWREFNKLLAIQAGEVGSYEVYNGISHVTLAPIIAQNCVKKIKIQNLDKLKHAPQYLWSYLIDNYGKEEFVVIGYNSPFHEFFEETARPLCEDMCDRIPWLKPLQIARKVYDFGYLICCPPDEVIGVLHGFPRIRNKHVFGFE